VAPAPAPARHVERHAEMLGVGAETGGMMFDPAGFSKVASPRTMKWFRAAELKHGRVSMLATVGWVIQASGLAKIPYHLEDGTLGPLSAKPFEANAQLWNLASSVGWLQIIATIGIVEIISESAVKPHYMSDAGDGTLDVFGYLKSGNNFDTLRTQELKNGRLAMIGIASFASAALVPGSVPGVPF